MRAPFPWFGGKSRVAPLVWERFGPVAHYIEPFAGSLAVLLGRPHAPNVETVNDLDGYVANFWRAVAAAPEAVARWADWPVNEIDLHARHAWLVAQSTFRETMRADPDYYDAQVAGWWVWGLSAWIGGGWCQSLSYRRPQISNAGMGIHGKTKRDLTGVLQALAARLRYVRVACGDWARVCTPAVTRNMSPTGVFLDPPYSTTERDPDLYAEDATGVAADVAAWARAHGDDPHLRIALCGYAGEHEMPGWDCVPWKAHGGYGVRAHKRGRANARRECIWFSPHCLTPLDLFADTTSGRAQTVAQYLSLENEVEWPMPNMRGTG